MASKRAIIRRVGPLSWLLGGLSKKQKTAGFSKIFFAILRFAFLVISSPPVPVLVSSSASSVFQHLVNLTAASRFVCFPSFGRPPCLSAVAAQAQPSRFKSTAYLLNLVWVTLRPSSARFLYSSLQPLWFTFLPGFTCLTTQSSGTSVETLDSCELTSGASAPYLGC